MRRATTPTHTFTLPEEVKVSDVSEVLITYGQNGINVLEKTTKDVGRDTTNNRFVLMLTEDETNLFAPGKAVIQMRAKINTTVVASQMICIMVKPALDSNSGKV